MEMYEVNLEHYGGKVKIEVFKALLNDDLEQNVCKYAKEAVKKKYL